jgi:uncharacterized protein (TIGR03118 family)
MSARRRSLLTTRPNPLRLELLEERSNPSTAYLATDLISDQPGVAAITDPTLVNAWGISINGGNGALWVSANGTGLSEVYSTALTQPFKVTIPGGSPTDQVFANIAGNFVVNGVNSAGNPATGPSVFIFASESGTISGWNPAVFAAKPPGPGPSTNAFAGFTADDGAIYKGLALATVNGSRFLYATDFHNGKIDVIDGQFHKVAPGTNGFGTFTDPNLPSGYAPFNVALIDGKLYVSYAKQDAAAEDDVAGRGNGFISVFETNGQFVGRLVSHGDLNSPWGLAKAPADFGDFGGALLVGNFGDGKIHAYDPTSGKELGTLEESRGHPIVIDGLWGLSFGNGTTVNDANTLYYAAGPDQEAHGLFGKITANAAGTNPVSAQLEGSDLIITGSRNSDRVQVEATHGGRQIEVKAGGQKIGEFDAGDIGTIRFHGFAGDDVLTVSPKIDAAVIADGGAGRDVLNGGGDSSILLGNTDNDVLIGGLGRNILIGGDGRDLLIGSLRDDIVIGGPTVHDGDEAALEQILAVWTSTDSYTQRVEATRTGAGGVPKLDATTVQDDGDRDHLVGGPGLDWFFASAPDSIVGRRSSEPVG